MTVVEVAARRHRSRAERLLALLPYVSLAGLLTLGVCAALSFEDPRGELLLLSGVLLLAAPVGLALHLAVTRHLTRAEKRAWLRGLTGRDAMAVFAAYFAGDGRLPPRRNDRNPMPR